MRFPLLVNASPSTISNGPKVLLRPGKWKVVSDHRDSELFLVVDGVFQDIKQEVTNTDPVPVSVTIKTAGREKELNIFLESV